MGGEGEIGENAAGTFRRAGKDALKMRFEKSFR